VRVWQSSWWRRRLAQAPKTGSLCKPDWGDSSTWGAPLLRIPTKLRGCRLYGAAVHVVHSLRGTMVQIMRTLECQLLTMETWQWCRREPTSSCSCSWSPSSAAAGYAWGSAKTRSTSGHLWSTAMVPKGRRHASLSAWYKTLRVAWNNAGVHVAWWWDAQRGQTIVPEGAWR